MASSSLSSCTSLQHTAHMAHCTYMSVPFLDTPQAVTPHCKLPLADKQHQASGAALAAHVRQPSCLLEAAVCCPGRGNGQMPRSQVDRPKAKFPGTLAAPFQGPDACAVCLASSAPQCVAADVNLQGCHARRKPEATTAACIHTVPLSVEETTQPLLTTIHLGKRLVAQCQGMYCAELLCLISCFSKAPALHASTAQHQAGAGWARTCMC